MCRATRPQLKARQGEAGRPFADTLRGTVITCRQVAIKAQRSSPILKLLRTAASPTGASGGLGRHAHCASHSRHHTAARAADSPAIQQLVMRKCMGGYALLGSLATRSTCCAGQHIVRLSATMSWARCPVWLLVALAAVLLLGSASAARSTPDTRTMQGKVAAASSSSMARISRSRRFTGPPLRRTWHAQARCRRCLAASCSSSTGSSPPPTAARSGFLQPTTGSAGRLTSRARQTRLRGLALR